MKVYKPHNILLKFNWNLKKNPSAIKIEQKAGNGWRIISIKRNGC